MPEVTRVLAGYINASRWADIPLPVRHEATRALLNCLGCAIGSTQHETVESALAAIREFSGPPQAAVFGRSERLDILHAALINGISAHVLDYDDTHARAVHPSAPLLPALLAFAEWRKISGADLIHAYVLGVETECRIALSVYPEHYDRGWHITGELGKRFELMSNMYKPYACGLVVHAAIDGCIQLRNEYALTPESIARVELTVCPVVMELTAIKEPCTGLEGKFSIFHAAATAIVFGAAGEPQFGDAVVLDERVVALRRRVTVTQDAALTKIQARVTVVLNDGRRLGRFVENALGTLARPMSDADLEIKFRSLTDSVLSRGQADHLIKLCWSAPDLTDAADIARATVPQ